MELRKCICDAIEMIDLDCPFKLKEEEKSKKITLWHIKLKNVSDKAIQMGLEKELDSDSREFPRVGHFKSLCVTRQTSNFEEEKEAYVPEPPGIAKRNAKAILNKLLAMNKK